MPPQLSRPCWQATAQHKLPQNCHTHLRSSRVRYLCSLYRVDGIGRTSNGPCGLTVCTARASHHGGFAACIPLLSLILPTVAFADDTVAYNAGSQSEFLQNLAGVVYVGLVAYLLYKVFTRRAKRFTSEVRPGRAAPCMHNVNNAPVPLRFLNGPICATLVQKLTSANEEVVQAEDPELAEPLSVTPFDALIGAVQALGIAAGLYIFATKMDGVLLAAPLPEQYTVRNMAVTVRTVLRGLVYLATFIFAANGVGLSALALKLLVFGEDERDPAVSDSPKIPKNIPNVGLTSNLDDVMRAFDEASDVTKYQKKQKDSK